MDPFRKRLGEARKDLERQGLAIPSEPDPAAVIKDLELQWSDHFHMRDQTWKTLSNSALLFVGVVGLEIYKQIPNLVMIAAYLALILVSSLGLLVALHHRHIQQKIKTPIILRYEILLGLMPTFEDILAKHSSWGLGTASFIVVSHLVLVIVSSLLLATKVCIGLLGTCPVAL